jgi:hypothetical protein
MFFTGLMLIALTFALTVSICSRAQHSPASQTGQASTDVQWRVKTYEANCVGSLRILNTAEGTYWGGDPQKGYARSLEQLGPKGVDFIEPTLASGKKAGYRFVLTPGPANANGVVMHYTITARPLKILAKRQRSFFTDETGVIRSTLEDRAARASDPAIQ